MTPLKAAHAADIAYEYAPAGALLAHEIGYTYNFSTHGDAQFWWGDDHQGHRVIAFCGTEFTRGKWRDLLANLLSEQTSWAGPGHVHVGYHWQFMQILRELGEVIRASEGRWIAMAGHSMGGCLATLAAAYFHPQVREVHTFGSPRVGDRKFAGWANDALDVRRYVNRWDIFTYYPFGGVRRGGLPGVPHAYKHVGQKIDLDATGHWIPRYIKGARKLEGAGPLIG